MILDNVLEEEEVIYNEDSMVDMFVEGFLYALEMQENGQKASSMEELSETLSEAADSAISEISADLANKTAQKAQALADRHERLAKQNDKYINNDNSNPRQGAYSKRDMHNQLAYKYQGNADRINERIVRKNKYKSKNYEGIK